MDCKVLKNYRPVTNLSFMSKALERVAYSQILGHITSNSFTDLLQSAYKSKNTETALVPI